LSIAHHTKLEAADKVVNNMAGSGEDRMDICARFVTLVNLSCALVLVMVTKNGEAKKTEVIISAFLIVLNILNLIFQCYAADVVGMVRSGVTALKGIPAAYVRDMEAKKKAYVEQSLNLYNAAGNSVTPNAVQDILRGKQAILDWHNPDDRYRTAAHAAAENGFPEVLLPLLQAGANLREHDELGQTALHIAMAHGRGECVELLQQFSVDETVLAHRPEALIEAMSEADKNKPSKFIVSRMSVFIGESAPKGEGISSKKGLEATASSIDAGDDDDMGEDGTRFMRRLDTPTESEGVRAVDLFDVDKAAGNALVSRRVGDMEFLVRHEVFRNPEAVLPEEGVEDISTWYPMQHWAAECAANQAWGPLQALVRGFKHPCLRLNSKDIKIDGLCEVVDALVVAHKGGEMQRSSTYSLQVSELILLT
jgi:hypothetical protein